MRGTSQLAPPDAVGLPVGTPLHGGRFRLSRPIGEGTHGALWRASDGARASGAAVAVLRPHLASDPQAVERFFRFTRAAGALGHPGVVSVLVPHAVEDGLHYYVVDPLERGDLRDAILGGRLDPMAAIDKVCSAARGLEALNGHGVVHREIGPGNLVVDGRGELRLADLGPVRGVLGARGAGGSPYAAPESVRPGAAVDARADVWGLAMTAVFCIQRHDPAADAARDPHRLVQRLRTSHAIRQVLHDALASDPADRTPTVRAFTDALEDAVRRGRAPSEGAATLGPGARIGPYTVIDQLGHDAAGRFYRARAPRGRTVVLRRLGTSQPASPAVRERIFWQVRDLVRLRHPGIARVHGVETVGGEFVLVRDFVEGTSLEGALTTGRPLPPVVALSVFRQAAEALDAAHRVGVLHGRLTPANLLLDLRGTAQLVDFGVECAVGADAAPAIASTERYLAPECQARGDVGAAVDVYAAGICLYEALTAWAPTLPGDPAGHREALGRALGRVAAPALPGRDRDRLVLLIARMCDHRPARRPSAAEVAQELAAIVPTNQASRWDDLLGEVGTTPQAQSTRHAAPGAPGGPLTDADAIGLDEILERFRGVIPASVSLDVARQLCVLLDDDDRRAHPEAVPPIHAGSVKLWVSGQARISAGSPEDGACAAARDDVQAVGSLLLALLASHPVTLPADPARRDPVLDAHLGALRVAGLGAPDLPALRRLLRAMCGSSPTGRPELSACAEALDAIRWGIDPRLQRTVEEFARVALHPSAEPQWTLVPDRPTPTWPARAHAPQVHREGRLPTWSRSPLAPIAFAAAGVVALLVAAALALT